MNNKNYQVLLAEDEPNFGTVLKSYLSLGEYDVVWCKTGKEAYSKMQEKSFDICILDVMMPEMDGFTLAKEIRKKDANIPLIFLTAKNDKSDVLKGFKLGADDYLTKPFDSDILLEKLRVLLKRKNGDSENSPIPKEIKIGKFNFMTASRKLQFEGNSKTLSPKETALLIELCLKPNQVLSRSRALEKIWGDDNYFTARSMDVYVAKLRKYLKADPSIKIINIHGNGFQLCLENTSN